MFVSTNFTSVKVDYNIIYNNSLLSISRIDYVAAKIKGVYIKI